ncbi:hypothetical protein B0H10DRAFT_2438144 [Mycena sp. CBHHK59/15]|nr:hypothetical protein B0H10DRAFT_2438144 [Mycena sp. CBHHK59/15]
MHDLSNDTARVIIRQLQSEKVTERQDGLKGLRIYFSQHHILATFHISEKNKSTNKPWLCVYQALFSAILSEKLAFTKRATDAVKRRLADAAAAVLWLTQRSVQYLTSFTVHPLLDHIQTTLIYQGELFAPVALDYLKTLKCVLDFTPHLDRLDDNRWIKIVEMGFNVVLGDPIRTTFSDDDPAESCLSPAPAPEIDDSEFFLENEDDSDAPSTASPSKKRHRREATAAPGPSSKFKSQYKPSKPSQASMTGEASLYVGIISILLRSSNAPLLSKDAAYLPSSILLRLQRILEVYPVDASLYPDYLLITLSTLSHLSLNRKDNVVIFAQRSWDSLVALWRTKEKSTKVGLVAVLRLLFPFLTAGHDKSSHDWSEGISHLWRLLDGEAESRWGVDGLSLDCLRLELAGSDHRMSGVGDTALVASTFRAGWNFDSGQALAWAILELQADCAEKLFQHSECNHSHTGTPARRGRKRSRAENPISSLLDSMQEQTQSRVRGYHLQTLLFFIDRHWSVLHDALQQTVFSALISFISLDDPLVQSWTFLCFAAIAYSDSHAVVSTHNPLVARDWDTMWTHAIRRTNVPGVSRAACQAAYALLLYSHSHSESPNKLLLTPQRILLEIETLAKDLDVQGPPFPYDSVCIFLSQALRAASHDVRLYRMQFEEKALSWIVDCWTVRDSGKMPLHLIKDVLLLLETICGLSKRSDLFCRVILPECLIVETLVEQEKVKIIRDYLLTATIPQFRSQRAASKTPLTSVGDQRHIGDDLVEPGARERKVSVFLLKSLEGLASDLETLSKATTLPVAEKARISLDWAVVALSFEAILALNGTRSNRRVIQAACKVILLVAPLIKDKRWTDGEKAMILLSLEPLTSTGEHKDDDGYSVALLPPDLGSGIKNETLQSLISGPRSQDDVVTQRVCLQRLICQSADVQDAFEAVMKVQRDLLRDLIGVLHTDGFVADQSQDINKRKAEHSSICCIAQVCIAFLTVIPVLQSASGEPSNDRELTDLVLTCAETQTETALLIYSIFLSNVRQKTIALSKLNLDLLLDELKTMLISYRYARSDKAQMMVIQLLDCTLHIWAVASESTVRELCAFLPKALRAGDESRTHIRSWKIRDALARLFDRYLMNDPSEASWFQESDFADPDDRVAAKQRVPTKVLPAMNRDEDIRVRFRAAVLNAHLFAVGRKTGLDAATMYKPIFESYPRNLENYENMLTRLLSLGNMMIVSSAVRRGAYWHLLEASLHTTLYALHTEAILGGVSQRLGMPTFAVLFEAYASQLAFTIKIRGADFLRFPPRLLGYKDRKECAEANFLAFTPTNLVAEGEQVGRKLFEGHCKVIQKSIAEGIRDCFPDIIGYQILKTLLDVEMGHVIPTEELETLLLQKTMSEDDAFHDALRENVDGVITWIARTLGDQDFSPEGPIVSALGDIDACGKAPDVFKALVRHRTPEDFETHVPNVPSFPSSTILQALSWFDSFVPGTDAKATSYHVVHELFADIQRSPLVNEQLRLINALCLWISFRHESFQDPTLLHALIRGATSLMAQFDLARAAQSILEWVFDCYRTARPENPRFADILIRICCSANDYARKPHNSPMQSLGKDLRLWIDCQIMVLSTVKSKSLNASILRALSAWPHTPSPQLTELVQSITSSSLSTVLSDPSIVSNKFRLVRQLRDHALKDDCDAGQFAGTDFWRLRECIPPSEQLQGDDIDAFASLLVLHKGRINSFGTEQPILTIRSHQRLDMHKSPQNWIIHVLLVMLEASAAPEVHVAYRTLRSVMSVSAPNIATHLPVEYREELEYLQAYRRIPKTRPVRRLDELLTSDAYLEVIGDFPRWVGMITTLLSDILSVADPFYAQLTLILQSDPTFAEQMLPILVHTLLQSERSEQVKQGRNSRNLPCKKTLSEYFTAVLKSKEACIPCSQSIVSIVLHLRNSVPALLAPDELAYDKWLGIDYTLLARNAIVCGAYTTALLFLELATEYGGSAATDDNAAEQILYEIYSHIDEPDGFYGIKTQDLHQFLIKRFHHEKQWEKAFQFHSAALEAGSKQAAEADGLVQSFHSFGFNHLAIDTLQSSSFGTGAAFNSPGMNYRLGWRTETWDLPDRKGERNPGAPLYLALRAVHRERNPLVIQTVLRDAVCEEMGRLGALGSENLAEIRDAAQTLMCLNQVAQWFHSTIQDCLASRQTDISNWAGFVDLDPGFEFSDFENIMATRISLVRSVRRKEERQQIGTLVSPFAQCLLDVEKQCLIRLSKAARDAQQIQIALNSVIRAQSLEQSPSFGVSEEFASVLRLHKEEKLAVQFLKDLKLTHLPRPEEAVILARLGTWMAEACLENPTDISSRYFEPATRYVNDFKATNVSEFTTSHAAVYHQYAIFAERQYKAIRNSPDAIRWRVYVDRKTQEIRRREEEMRKSQTNESTKALNQARKLLVSDKELFQKHNSARETFLVHAVEMYSRALEASDAFDGDGAIRLCSLWFENFDETEHGLQDLVRTALDRIPSRKLVFLAHQLSARLSKTSEMAKNQENLQSVVLRMCMEHPFHSLYQVYCLLPNQAQTAPTNRRQSGRHSSPATQTQRAGAAVAIFDRLRGDPGSEKRIKDVEFLASACLEWAKHKIKKTPLAVKGSKPHSIPKDLSIRKIVGLKVPVLTYHTPLDPSSRYDNCVFISRFETTFETAGGVNLPKISQCIGDDGVKYKQLFKGEGDDDLRQDAVMEQVFELVNTVLSGDRETSRRALSVRGYKIIPLAAQAGVLEFVDNTTCIQTWLKTAHQSYRPQDWHVTRATEYMKKAQLEFKDEPEKQLVRFQETKEHFQPVMRHFFTEKHKLPQAWFAMRLNYIRSVATTSIVGHVLGLGDRHGSNILLDMKTGEVVHIDLGIAFDQGKLLPVPELVPFRMTRDVVDGMGAAGTQGVFQRCAEETLRVLRAGSEVIMTVLEVFKHDPLHSWTVSDIKVNKVMREPDESEGAPAPAGTRRTVSGLGLVGIGIDMASGTADEAADRALTSVARKLDKALSVEYTVNELIAEATDQMKLATIFYGWGAIF